MNLIAADALGGEAVQHAGAVAQGPHDTVAHGEVVLGEVALGLAAFGEIDAVGTRQADGPFAHI